VDDANRRKAAAGKPIHRCHLRQNARFKCSHSCVCHNGRISYSTPAVALVRLDDDLVQRLFGESGGARWSVPVERFAEALKASVERALSGKPTNRAAMERHLRALHLEDLALACACADGHENAWEQFIREYRPALYRAADALEPGGGARDLADSLYADLYGLTERGGQRRSLFTYYHGRSSLATWLRAVLAQRHVDRVRAGKRFEPLPDEPPEAAASSTPPDFDRARHLALIERALLNAVDGLPARDRLRLCSYYAEDLTLAQTGRLLNEHEATVSRQLARTRRVIREQVEAELSSAGLTQHEVLECFQSAAEDARHLDLAVVLSSAADHDSQRVSAGAPAAERPGSAERKDPASDRSY
jgi:RNA polymerase sigma-70 factor, ECF subfamily